MTKKKRTLFRKQIIWSALAGLAALLLLAALTDYLTFRRYEAAATMRGLISEAMDNLQQPVLRDPKSGDYYLPELKLTVPASENLWRLKYYADAKEQTANISVQSVMSRAKSDMITAKSVEELFRHVPQYQACSRGVQLQFTKPQEGISWQKQLADGRTLYAYADKDCSSIGELSNALRTIDSY